MAEHKNTTETVIDARGLICPIPVLKARKKMQDLQQGEILIVLSDDPKSLQDFQHFCQTQGHKLLAQTSDEKTSSPTSLSTLTHKIRKNSGKNS